jgi:hypothetical protein
MRLLLVVLTGLLVSAPIAAQQAESSSRAAGFPSSAANTTPTLDLPVSLDRIRTALERPTRPVRLLKGLEDTPTFRVEIRERQRIEELLAALDFKGGPTPPGGVYGFEQQRLLFPSVDNPLAQPYSAFNHGQLVTILIENLVGTYLADRAGETITKAVRARAEEKARRQVEEAIAEYCTSKPNGGVGLELCQRLPADR